MALIRKELAVRVPDAGEKNIYDCLVEAAADFASDTELTDVVGIGSMAYCLGDKKVYAKTNSGWGAV